MADSEQSARGAASDPGPNPGLGPDEVQRRYARARELLDGGHKAIAEGRHLLGTILPAVTNARARGEINRRIWEADRLAGHRQQFFSQAGQDSWLDQRVFRGRRAGTFVEIGGYDGITGSNCLFFELIRGWSGILVEPSPTFHARAAALRRVPCLQVAVAADAGEAEFLEVSEGFSQMSGLTASYDPGLRATVEADPRHRGELIRVPTRPLAAILDDHGLAEIDYVSLDVEGGELAILRAFPFERYRITAWTIENNAATRNIPALMHDKGYLRVEALGVDDVYVLRSSWPG